MTGARLRTVIQCVCNTQNQNFAFWKRTLRGLPLIRMLYLGGFYLWQTRYSLRRRRASVKKQQQQQQQHAFLSVLPKMSVRCSGRCSEEPERSRHLTHWSICIINGGRNKATLQVHRITIMRGME
jgi:hypothetical protein